MDRYTLIKEIGKGAFGVAYIVQHKASGQRYVLKKIKLARLSFRERQGSLRELQLLSSFKHRNILSFHEAWLEGGCIVCIVVELCESGDLATQLRLRQPHNQYFPEAHLHEMLVQLASGLAHLHRNSVVHRDIKGSNVFITSQGLLKLADFGLATTAGEGLCKTLVGTPGYMAPQLMTGNVEYDGRKNDVWGLACVLYEASALKPAFQAFNLASLVKKVTSGTVPPLPSHYSDNWKGIIKAMLVKDESKRPSVDDILALPWLQEVRERVAARFGGELPEGVNDKVSMARLPADIQQLADQLKQQQDEAEERERINRQRRKVLQAKYAPKGLLQKQAQEELAALSLDTPARPGAQSAGAAGGAVRGRVGVGRPTGSLTARTSGMADKGASASILNRVRPTGSVLSGHKGSDVGQRGDTTKRKDTAVSKPGAVKGSEARPCSAPPKHPGRAGSFHGQGDRDTPCVLRTDGRPQIMDDVPPASLRPPHDQLASRGSREPIKSCVSLVGGVVMTVSEAASHPSEGIRSLKPGGSFGHHQLVAGEVARTHSCTQPAVSSTLSGRFSSRPSLIPTRSSTTSLRAPAGDSSDQL